MTKRLLALVLLLPGLVLVGATRADADPAAAAGLPRGKEAAVPYLVGRTVHRPSGRQVMLAIGRSHVGHLELLGKSNGRRGWVVVDWHDGVIRVLVATRKRVDVIRKTADYTNASWYRLSRNRRAVMELYAERDVEVTHALVVGVDGRVIRRRTIRGYGELLDLSGSRAVLNIHGDTLLWRIGEKPVTISDAGSATARLDTGTLFVRTPDGVGPTRIGAPGEPAWTARFAPREVSPDGTFVAGTADGTLQIRRVDTGAVVADPALRYRDGDPFTWESDRAVLVGVRDSGRQALARCRVDGHCVRATDWVSSRLTTPFQTRYFSE